MGSLGLFMTITMSDSLNMNPNTMNIRPHKILSSPSITCNFIVQTFKAFVNTLFSFSSTKERRT